jgi:hypothetical protein
MVSINTVLCATALGAETCIFKPIVNLNEITDAVDRAFEKIDRWWIALKDWIDRKKVTDDAAQAVRVESQLLSDIPSVFGCYRYESPSDISNLRPTLQQECG